MKCTLPEWNRQMSSIDLRPAPVSRASIPGRGRVARFLLLLSASTIIILGSACSPAAPTGAASSPAPAPTASPAVAPKPTSPSTPAISVNAGSATPSSKSQTVPTVTVEQMKALLAEKNPPKLFDARPKPSYDSGHIPGAVSLPLDDLEMRLGEVPNDYPSVFYCSGST